SIRQHWSRSKRGWSDLLYRQTVGRGLWAKCKHVHGWTIHTPDSECDNRGPDLRTLSGPLSISTYFDRLLGIRGSQDWVWPLLSLCSAPQSVLVSGYGSC